MGSLFYSGLGRVAPLSATITGVPVHFIRNLNIYVRCHGQGGCLLCQNNFKIDTRSGIWVLDYAEQDRKYLIKIFATVSENLTRVMHAIANSSGLQQHDWVIEKSSNGKGIYIRQQEGLPQWFQSAKDVVVRMWEPYKEKDMSKYLARQLGGDEMQQVLNGTYNKDRKPGSSYSPAGRQQGQPAVGSVLGGQQPAAGTAQPQQGWTPPATGAGAQPQQKPAPQPQQGPQGGWQPPTAGTQPQPATGQGTAPSQQPKEDPLKGLL